WKVESTLSTGFTKRLSASAVAEGERGAGKIWTERWRTEKFRQTGSASVPKRKLSHGWTQMNTDKASFCGVICVYLCPSVALIRPFQKSILSRTRDEGPGTRVGTFFCPPFFCHQFSCFFCS